MSCPSQWRDLLEAQPATEEPWPDVARRGGYPTPAYELETPEQRRLWFEGYLRTYLERDVQAVAAIDNLPAYETVVRSMALRSGTIVNQTARVQLEPHEAAGQITEVLLD